MAAGTPPPDHPFSAGCRLYDDSIQQTGPTAPRSSWPVSVEKAPSIQSKDLDFGTKLCFNRSTKPRNEVGNIPFVLHQRHSAEPGMIINKSEKKKIYNQCVIFDEKALRCQCKRAKGVVARLLCNT